MTEKIIIEKSHALYRLTAYPGRSLVVTAQDMRDIFDYCLQHRAEIEAEAKPIQHPRSYEEIETEIQELREQEEREDYE